jgi:hypothetical protein
MHKPSDVARSKLCLVCLTLDPCSDQQNPKKNILHLLPSLYRLQISSVQCNLSSFLHKKKQEERKKQPKKGEEKTKNERDSEQSIETRTRP